MEDFFKNTGNLVKAPRNEDEENLCCLNFIRDGNTKYLKP